MALLRAPLLLATALGLAAAAAAAPPSPPHGAPPSPGAKTVKMPDGCYEGRETEEHIPDFPPLHLTASWTIRGENATLGAKIIECADTNHCGAQLTDISCSVREPYRIKYEPSHQNDVHSGHVVLTPDGGPEISGISAASRMACKMAVPPMKTEDMSFSYGKNDQCSWFCVPFLSGTRLQIATKSYTSGCGCFRFSRDRFGICSPITFFGLIGAALLIVFGCCGGCAFLLFFRRASGVSVVVGTSATQPFLGACAVASSSVNSSSTTTVIGGGGARQWPPSRG